MNKNLFTAIIFTITLVMLAPFGADRLLAQNCQWANSAGGNGFDYGQSVTTDANGDVYMTGTFFSPTITFGAITLTNNTTSASFFITKYDSNGNVLWARSTIGNGSNYGQSVSTDASGNVFVTGCFNFTITFGSTTLTTASNFDFFIAKYDANGNVLWAKSAIGIGTDNALSVSTDNNGNLYIIGHFNGPTITFGSISLTNTISTGNNHDIFIAKYDVAGNVLWAKSVGGSGGDYGQSVATDASGNVYMSGSFNSPTITIDSTTLTNANDTGNTNDIFIIKYDATGNFLWAKSAGGTNNELGNSVSTDASGNVYITGNFQSPTITFDTTILSKVNSNGNGGDIFIAKFDSSGNVLWAKSEGGNLHDSGESVSTDASGNFFITGSFSGAVITLGTTNLTNAGNSGFNDIFIAKYNASGNVLWAKSAGGTKNEFGKSVANDAYGNVYISGQFISPTIYFGSPTLTNAINTGNSPDIFIAKYSNPTPCSAFYTLFPDSTLQSYWYLVNQCMGSDSLSADSLDYVWSWGDSANSTSIGAYPSFTYNTAGNYTICVTVTDSSTGCTNTYCDSSAYISRSSNQMITVNVIPANSPLITGVSSSSISKSNEVGLTPNPSSSNITLTIPKPINTNITITNLTGKQVATYNLQNTTTKTIDVSHLAEGVYFITLKSHEGVVTKKLVKRN